MFELFKRKEKIETPIKKNTIEINHFSNDKNIILSEINNEFLFIEDKTKKEGIIIKLNFDIIATFKTKIKKIENKEWGTLYYRKQYNIIFNSNQSDVLELYKFSYNAQEFNDDFSERFKYTNNLELNLIEILTKAPATSNLLTRKQNDDLTNKKEDYTEEVLNEFISLDEEYTMVQLERNSWGYMNNKGEIILQVFR